MKNDLLKQHLDALPGGMFYVPLNDYTKKPKYSYTQNPHVLTDKPTVGRLTGLGGIPTFRTLIIDFDRKGMSEEDYVLRNKCLSLILGVDLESVSTVATPSGGGHLVLRVADEDTAVNAFILSGKAGAYKAGFVRVLSRFVGCGLSQGEFDRVAADGFELCFDVRNGSTLNYVVVPGSRVNAGVERLRELNRLIRGAGSGLVREDLVGERIVLRSAMPVDAVYGFRNGESSGVVYPWVSREGLCRFAEVYAGDPGLLAGWQRELWGSSGFVESVVERLVGSGEHPGTVCFSRSVNGSGLKDVGALVEPASSSVAVSVGGGSVSSGRGGELVDAGAPGRCSDVLLSRAAAYDAVYGTDRSVLGGYELFEYDALVRVFSEFGVEGRDLLLGELGRLRRVFGVSEPLNVMRGLRWGYSAARGAGKVRASSGGFVWRNRSGEVFLGGLCRSVRSERVGDDGVVRGSRPVCELVQAPSVVRPNGSVVRGEVCAVFAPLVGVRGGRMVATPGVDVVRGVDGEFLADTRFEAALEESGVGELVSLGARVREVIPTVGEKKGVLAKSGAVRFVGQSRGFVPLGERPVVGGERLSYARARFRLAQYLVRWVRLSEFLAVVMSLGLDYDTSTGARLPFMVLLRDAVSVFVKVRGFSRVVREDRSVWSVAVARYGVRQVMMNTTDGGSAVVGRPVGVSMSPRVGGFVADDFLVGREADGSVSRYGGLLNAKGYRRAAGVVTRDWRVRSQRFGGVYDEARVRDALLRATGGKVTAAVGHAVLVMSALDGVFQNTLSSSMFSYEHVMGVTGLSRPQVRRAKNLLVGAGVLFVVVGPHNGSCARVRLNMGLMDREGTWLLQRERALVAQGGPMVPVCAVFDRETGVVVTPYRDGSYEGILDAVAGVSLCEVPQGVRVLVCAMRFCATDAAATVGEDAYQQRVRVAGGNHALGEAYNTVVYETAAVISGLCTSVEEFTSLDGVGDSITADAAGINTVGVTAGILYHRVLYLVEFGVCFPGLARWLWGLRETHNTYTTTSAVGSGVVA